tara:strand:+ start:1078 stop:2568 length:1491 start_codon:yes stop_codon:yes gene_type:complete
MGSTGDAVAAAKEFDIDSWLAGKKPPLDTAIPMSAATNATVGPPIAGAGPDGGDLEWHQQGYPQQGPTQSEPAPEKKWYQADEGPYSGTILPFSRSKSGDIGDVSLDSDAGVAGMIKRPGMLPGQVLRGEIDPTSDEGMRRTTEAAMLMTPMGAASRVGGAALAPKPGMTKPEIITAKELKGQANKIYEDVKKEPVTVRPEAFRRMFDEILTIVKEKGFAPGMHTKSKAALDEIAKYLDRPLDMQQMAIVRRLAKSAKKNYTDEDDARIGGFILKHIDDNMRQIPGVGKELVKADKLWSMAKKSELLDKAVDAAKHTASGFENGLRIEFRKLLKQAREGKLQLSAEETAAMQKVVSGSISANVLKGIGKLGPAPGGAGNALLAVLAGGGGYALGGPLGMGAVMGGGYGARLGAQAITKGAAERARAVVAGGRNPAVPTAPGSPTGIPDTMVKALASSVPQQQGGNGSMNRALGGAAANRYQVGPNGGQMIDGIEYF